MARSARAGIVEHPAEYRWSSYRANAQREAFSLLSPHDSYLALDMDQETFTTNYRELFRSQLDHGLIDEIRNSTDGNYALGSGLFQKQVAEMLGRRVTHGKSGRPGKEYKPVIS